MSPSYDYDDIRRGYGGARSLSNGVVFIKIGWRILVLQLAQGKDPDFWWIGVIEIHGKSIQNSA